jgi:hypothetical protein
LFALLTCAKMSARPLTHSPTTVDALDTLGQESSDTAPPAPVSSETPPGPSFEPEPSARLRSAGQYECECFEQTVDPCGPGADPGGVLLSEWLSERTGSESVGPWKVEVPPTLSRSPGGL